MQRVFDRFCQQSVNGQRVLLISLRLTHTTRQTGYQPAKGAGTYQPATRVCVSVERGAGRLARHVRGRLSKVIPSSGGVIFEFYPIEQCLSRSEGEREMPIVNARWAVILKVGEECAVTFQIPLWDSDQSRKAIRVKSS
jgi:hypothetical protein